MCAGGKGGVGERGVGECSVNGGDGERLRSKLPPPPFIAPKDGYFKIIVSTMIVSVHFGIFFRQPYFFHLHYLCVQKYLPDKGKNGELILFRYQISP